MEDIPTKKSLGQHWLKDESVLEAIADAGEIKDTDTVLEIGPGPGTLTDVLIKRAQEVYAVELDDYLYKRLVFTYVNQPKVKLYNEDILSFDFSMLPEQYKLVANIPYYLTSNLIRRISELENPPNRTVLLVQKEVAQRITANPGKLSLLGVSAQFYFETYLDILVTRNMFTPPPKVDSQVVVLVKRDKPLYHDVDPTKFFMLVKTCFNQKRKTIRNSLSTGMRIKSSAVVEACNKVNIDPMRRPQTLSLDEWHDLYVTFNA
jgi:16S rRNA (adenine1518-N6/adenine1519-N6)-dimethyltransferase